MKPYYQDGVVAIYQGDCREVLPHLPKADLVLTDPPFFIRVDHFQSRVKWQRSWGDLSVLGTFWAAILDAAPLKETGHFLSFCNGDSYPVFYPEMYRRYPVVKCLVWNKGHIGLGRLWRHQYELIIAARFKESFVDTKGKTYSDVIQMAATPPTTREHPVEKPAKLLEVLLEPITPLKGLILDPFMGGGSTLIAARNVGRRAIGMETEERYCEIAAKRLEVLAKDGIGQ